MRRFTLGVGLVPLGAVPARAGIEFVEHRVTQGYATPCAVQAVDMDRDTDLDILSAAYNGARVAWFENDGPQSFARRFIATGLGGAVALCVADLGRDGDKDVVASGFYSNSICWYESRPLGIEDAAQPAPESGGATAAACLFDASGRTVGTARCRPGVYFARTPHGARKQLRVR
jgi:hypothetical protein